MKLVIGRSELEIVITDRWNTDAYNQDLAYIEDTLGLKKHGDVLILKRENWNDGLFHRLIAKSAIDG